MNELLGKLVLLAKSLFAMKRSTMSNTRINTGNAARRDPEDAKYLKETD